MLLCAAFLCILHFICVGQGITVYNVKSGAGVEDQIVPIDSDGVCPTELEMDIYSTWYIVVLQVNCSDSEPCPIIFRINDELQASVFLTCGDLRSVKIPTCDSAKVILKEVRPHGKPIPLDRVTCRQSAMEPVACSDYPLQLQYQGLKPCMDFGRARISMRSRFFPTNVYYMDSAKYCSGQSLVEEKGTILSQHTETPAEDIPLVCQLSLVPPQIDQGYDLCITFKYAKFPCSLDLVIGNIRTPSHKRWDCRSFPMRSDSHKLHCLRLDEQRHINITVLRQRSSEKQGFAFNFEFHPILTTTATTLPPTTSRPEVEGSSSDGPALATTIAISVSVLVFVSLLYLGFRCFTSKYRPCCRNDDDDDDIEETPEQEHLQTFTALPADNVNENVETVIPTAPPAENYSGEPGLWAQAGGSGDSNRTNVPGQVRREEQPQQPASWAYSGVSGDGGGAPGSGQTDRAPPPCYDSLFPDK